jgi:hypothetical protein
LLGALPLDLMPAMLDVVALFVCRSSSCPSEWLTYVGMALHLAIIFVEGGAMASLHARRGWVMTRRSS